MACLLRRSMCYTTTLMHPELSLHAGPGGVRTAVIYIPVPIFVNSIQCQGANNLTVSSQLHSLSQFRGSVCADIAISVTTRC